MKKEKKRTNLSKKQEQTSYCNFFRMVERKRKKARIRQKERRLESWKAGVRESRGVGGKPAVRGAKQNRETRLNQASWLQEKESINAVTFPS